MLTERQKEIDKHFKAGKSVAEIASLLKIARDMVRQHAENIEKRKIFVEEKLGGRFPDSVSPAQLAKIMTLFRNSVVESFDELVVYTDRELRRVHNVGTLTIQALRNVEKHKAASRK